MKQDHGVLAWEQPDADRHLWARAAADLKDRAARVRTGELAEGAEWGLIRTFPASQIRQKGRDIADSFAGNIRRGNLTAFHPKGAWEAAAHKQRDGSVKVFARYTGLEQENDQG